MPTPILIDCDPGHDDAIAILLAIASPEVDLIGVTTVGGNSGLENTTRNALQVLELARRPDIPVAAGAAHPLSVPLHTQDHVHGATGLDGPDLPEPTSREVQTHAVDFIAETVASSDEPVTLIPTGPLTNVALLLRRHPDIAGQLDRIVLMGGGMAESNVTPAAEFNIWADPEAADEVFSAGLDVTMVGLDVTHQALLGPADIDRSAGNSARVVAEFLDFFGHFHRDVYGLEASPIHDAVAVAHVIWPDLLEVDEFDVAIETVSPLTRGRTVVDLNRVTGREPNTKVAVGIDGERFARLLVERLYRLP